MNNNKNPIKNLMDTIRRKKMQIKIAIFVSQVAAVFIVIMLLVIAVLYPMGKIQEGVSKVKQGITSFFDFITIGSNDQDKKFIEKLEHEYERFKALQYREGEFDIPIISSTIHHNAFVTPESFLYKGSEEDYEFDNSNHVVGDKQLRNFYFVANDKLGSAFGGKRGLIGNLVDVKFQTACVVVPPLGDPAWKDFLATISAIINDFTLYLAYVLEDEANHYLNAMNVFQTMRLIHEYRQQGESYIEHAISDYKYDRSNRNIVKEIIRMISNSNLSSCNSELGEVGIPVVVRYINHDLYKDYLRTFIPIQEYSKCKSCKYQNAPDEEKDYIVELVIDEIFEKRNMYSYLSGGEELAVSSIYVPGMSTFPIPTAFCDGKKLFSPDYVNSCINSGFGMRFHPIDKVWRAHGGVDFPVTRGTPLYALGDGVVEKVVNSCVEGVTCSTTYGNYVKVKHELSNGKTISTLYAHMRNVVVQVGDRVGGGQILGYSGNTGGSTGPHLHFEIYEGNTRVDPVPYLEGILNGDSIFDEASNNVYYYQGNYSNPYCTGGTTIAMSGALPTAYASAVSSLGNKVTPVEAANYICNNLSETKHLILSDIDASNHFGVRINSISNTIEAIKGQMLNKNRVIVSVRGGIFDVANNGNYLVIHSHQNGMYVVLDPTSKARTKAYSEDEIRTEILNNVNHGTWGVGGVVNE